MEDITMNGMTLLTTYGPLGICCAYFMYKDLVLNKSLSAALSEFTLAINLLMGGKVGE